MALIFLSTSGIKLFSPVVHINHLIQRKLSQDKSLRNALGFYTKHLNQMKMTVKKKQCAHRYILIKEK